MNGRHVQELARLSEKDRSNMLQASGVPPAALPGIQQTLLSLPQAHITAVKCFVDGEDDIKEQDMLTVQVFVVVTRASHIDYAAPASLGKAAVQALTPRFPHTVTEKWCVVHTSCPHHAVVSLHALRQRLPPLRRMGTKIGRSPICSTAGTPSFLTRR